MNAPSQIAHYKIKSKLGEGGMGVVYRASDTKLNRDVAIKILPPALAADRGRMTRFEREARVLASLDHPNIGAIYGLEESEGAWALVLALIEGPTLADRIAAGSIPVDEAIPIARQIAEALEYAHDRGVIHRDLKPANIKITPDGAVKILDFGLAKALAAETGQSASATLSPTLTLEATRAGVILGTAAYMAPEQAKGKAVDRRGDIWAFGAVLFEMLAGQRAFRGDSVTEILAAVIKEEPKFDRLPVATPRPVRRLIERCLQKDSRQRLQAIGEARIVLQNPAEDEAPQTAASAPAKSSKLPWALLAAAVLALAGLTWVHFRENAPAAPLVRFQIPAPEKTLFDTMVVLSPDGKHIAFRARDTAGGTSRIWVRSLDALDAHPLAGTEGAMYLFWSPDSRYLAFADAGKLAKVEASGGTVQKICDFTLRSFAGGTWGPDGASLFAVHEGLVRVSESGGATTSSVFLRCASFCSRVELSVSHFSDAFFRPPPFCRTGRRVREERSGFFFNSANPTAMARLETPLARATNDMPPRPWAALSAAAHNRRRVDPATVPTERNDA